MLTSEKALPLCPHHNTYKIIREKLQVNVSIPGYWLYTQLHKTSSSAQNVANVFLKLLECHKWLIFPTRRAKM